MRGQAPRARKKSPRNPTPLKREVKRNSSDSQCGSNPPTPHAGRLKTATNRTGEFRAKAKQYSTCRMSAKLAPPTDPEEGNKFPAYMCMMAMAMHMHAGAYMSTEVNAWTRMYMHARTSTSMHAPAPVWLRSQRNLGGRKTFSTLTGGEIRTA